MPHSASSTSTGTLLRPHVSSGIHTARSAPVLVQDGTTTTAAHRDAFVTKDEWVDAQAKKVL